MNKKELTEADIRTKFITPAIVGSDGSKWDVMTQLREEIYFTKGRVIVRGKTVKRGEAKKADYLLFYKPTFRSPSSRPRTTTTRSAPACSRRSNTPRFSTCRSPTAPTATRSWSTTAPAAAAPSSGKSRSISFPRPKNSGRAISTAKGYTPAQEAVATQDYYDDGSGKTPRYYQLIAINRTVEAIARGENRILLVMATGTGKTYTAFQIIWRLWKSGAKKRILFLVDRNILADQTKTNDFKPFGQAMTKITNRTVDKAFEIYLSPLSGRHRHRGRAEHLQAVLAGLLRPRRRGRVPSRQRRRRCSVAQGPRILLLRHADRPDRHAEGNQGRLQHRILRRPDLHLLAQAGHRGRLPRAVQGRAHRPRQGPRRLAARRRARPTSTAR